MEWSVIVSSFFGGALGALGSLATVLLNERVRSRLAAAVWLAQERWRFKVQFYRDILGFLDVEQRALYSLALTVREAEAQAGTAVPVTPEMRRLIKVVGTNREKAKQLRAISEVWLSPEAVQALDRFDEDTEATNEKGFDYDVVIARLAEARKELLETARRDLKLRIEGI